MLSKCTSFRNFLTPILSKRFIISSKFSSYLPSPTPPPSSSKLDSYDPKLMSLSVKAWFQLGNDTLLNRVFEILAWKGDDLEARRAGGAELCKLSLPLSESFVLKVLNYGKDVYPCLRFFDWAGHQYGFCHTRTTFHSIFKKFAKPELMPMMAGFLQDYKNQRYSYSVRFYDTLVMGYAITGKPDIALQLFGKMRFNGTDLDPFAYHVFLDALLEVSRYDLFDVVSKQITLRGLESEITSILRVKRLCKEKRIDEAKSYVCDLMSNGGPIDDHSISILVDALCKRKEFAEAGQLLEKGRDIVCMSRAYGIWIRNLTQAGKVDEALEFMRTKKFLEGYAPNVFCYNTLICSLLKENRLIEVYDLLMEMKNEQIAPDKVTMNASLCFFCKAGMGEVALDLFKSRSELRLSLHRLSYNYLIHTLCRDGSIDEAYFVLKDSIKQGYLPDKVTFRKLADALFSKGKLDKMEDLVGLSLEHKDIYNENLRDNKYFSALCRAGRLEDAYSIHCEHKRLSKVTNMRSYFHLINGFKRFNRGDIASKLLMDMQDSGLKPPRQLYRAVICCICAMDNPETHFYELLKMQWSRPESSEQICSFFIDGAGHAGKPEFAKEVFEMIGKRGLEPSLSSKIFMLQGYLKNERIADAHKFYENERNPSMRLHNTMVVGLCKAKEPDMALQVIRDLRVKGLVPSLQCYEELLHSVCSIKKYDMAVEVIEELTKARRPISSFIGNVLLVHSLTDQELYRAWRRSGVENTDSSSSNSLTIGNLIALFSGGSKVDRYLGIMDEVIELYFPLDLFTYNMLMKRAACLYMHTVDYAIELFDRMRKKGYQPNKWSYDVIIFGLCKNGRRDEALRWVDEMHRKGFELTKHTRQLLDTL
ncbi:hypothetical protein GIB67_018436 [Kingdonia uniflora]|uniref:Pentatricopeptide repeat-containing protein n=1 Tax=Kingdonia uniflora TaxID=39325 RepID=A0A7J7LJ76_9MAGN|nr:hypothetical protein GIB67_018436 [Kingdonia uniflora]